MSNLPLPPQASAGSSYHRSVHDLVNSAAGSNPYTNHAASRLQSQYLFLNSPAAAASRLSAPHCASVKTEAPWPSAPGAEYHTPTPAEFSHPLDRNYSPHAAYPAMAATGET